MGSLRTAASGRGAGSQLSPTSLCPVLAPVASGLRFGNAALRLGGCWCFCPRTVLALGTMPQLEQGKH